MKTRAWIAGWSFLLGSVLLTLEAANEMLSGVSLAAFLHLSEGLLFVVGSYFFLPAPDDSSD